MSHEPEPIVIDRRHPAWVAAYTESIRSIGLNDSAEGDELTLRFSRRLADKAWLEIHAADQADAKALSDWKAARRAERDNALRSLATAVFNQNYGSLMPREKDVVHFTLAQHGDDLQKALDSLTDDFDPLADIPCPSVTP